MLELKYSRSRKEKTAKKSLRKRKRAQLAADAAANAASSADGETTAAAGGNDDSAGKKLLVKNLAFESSNKELRQLFGAFGQLKSVRMPRKFDGYVLTLSWFLCLFVYVALLSGAFIHRLMSFSMMQWASRFRFRGICQPQGCA